MAEIASCGINMTNYVDGDIPDDYKSLMTDNFSAFQGTWQEIKKICGSPDTILSKCGVGYIKRKATCAATLKSEFQIKSMDNKGTPEIHIKTYYPLGITKETTFPTNGSAVKQPDPDTCDWNCVAVWCNGRLIQKRTGKHGTMYDSRTILKHHPTNAVSDSPIMYFRWTLIDNDGTKHVVENFLKKIQ